jgi:esterase/lipase superfamily enzyme
MQRIHVDDLAGDPDPRTIDFLFATTRTREQNSFREKRNTVTTFGGVQVRIPEDHKMGNPRVPKIQQGIFGNYEEKLDPGKHFVITKLIKVNDSGPI